MVLLWHCVFFQYRESKIKITTLHFLNKKGNITTIINLCGSSKLINLRKESTFCYSQIIRPLCQLEAKTLLSFFTIVFHLSETSCLVN